MKLFGYTCFTTFWDDFTKVEPSMELIRGTYDLAMKQWKNDYKYLTELALVLNYKIGEWYDGDPDGTGKHTEIARLYSDLWTKTAKYAETHLKGAELAYYWRMSE